MEKVKRLDWKFVYSGAFYGVLFFLIMVPIVPIWWVAVESIAGFDSPASTMRALFSLIVLASIVVFGFVVVDTAGVLMHKLVGSRRAA